MKAVLLARCKASLRCPFDWPRLADHLDLEDAVKACWYHVVSEAMPEGRSDARLLLDEEGRPTYEPTVEEGDPFWDEQDLERITNEAEARRSAFVEVERISWFGLTTTRITPPRDGSSLD